MPTIMPQGDEIRKAVKWISEMRAENSSLSHLELLEQAGLKFNLSPVEEEFLAKWIKEEDR
jgi:hypothetical protein